MNAQQVLQAVLQLLAIFPSVEPALVQAIRDFEALFQNGNEPTQEDIDALLDRLKSQSATIQSMS